MQDSILTHLLSDKSFTESVLLELFKSLMDTDENDIEKINSIHGVSLKVCRIHHQYQIDLAIQQLFKDGEASIKEWTEALEDWEKSETNVFASHLGRPII